MPPAKRVRRELTDDWQQLRLYVATPEQEAYELLRPVVLFGRTPAERAAETGVAERTLRRKADLCWPFTLSVAICWQSRCESARIWARTD